MRRQRRTPLLTGVLLVGSAVVLVPPLSAQCADGTPPPCEVRARQVAARSVAPPSAGERSRRFLVLPFRNITRAPAYEWLVEGSPTLLADALGQWEDVYVVPPERLYSALGRHGLTPGQVMEESRVRRVAEETGGWTAVAGDVLVTGNRIQVSARVYDVVSGRVVVRAREEVSSDDDVRGAYDRLAGRLLQVAGLDVEAPRLAGVTTQSLEAYKAYQNGVAYYNRQELAKAQAELKRAVQLDSTFAQAYMKLAEASITRSEQLTNPQSEVYRYAEKALALSNRLPPRDREFVQSMSDLFRGQITSSRARLERLLALDSNNVEVLSKLADIEIIDPILVEQGGKWLPRGSRNRAARLAKQVLALDPQQHSMYSNLATVYSTAGGLNHGTVPGIRQDPPSLMALGLALSAQPETLFVAVMREDSIALLSAEEFDALPPGEVEASKRRAIEAAVAWAERWLAAAPEEGLAHLTASVVLRMAGRYDQALAEVAKAESIGIEIQYVANYAGRRLQILTWAGRYDDALVLADSLRRAGYFGGTALLSNPIAQLDAAWAFNVYLLTNRPAAADSLIMGAVTPLVTFARVDSAQALNSFLTVFGLRSGPRTPPAIPEIPNHVREAALDTLVAHVNELPESSVLRTRLGTLGAVVYRGLRDERAREVSARFRGLAERWSSEAKADLAFQALFAVEDVDTSAAHRDAVFDAYWRLARGNPPDQRALYRIGRLAAISGQRLEQGEEAFKGYLAQPAPRGEPTHADANWRLGQVYEKMGRRDLARTHYEKALELNPAHAQAKQSLDALLKSAPPRL